MTGTASPGGPLPEPLVEVPDTWTTGTLARPGATLHYTRTGTGRQPAVVLLHGAMDNGLCWLRVALALEADYDVVMPDARGHGRTEVDPVTVTVPGRGPGPRAVGRAFSMTDMAEDVAALIDELGLAPVAVVGHSMGAQVATELAARHPDRVSRVVLEDPAYALLATPGPRLWLFGGAMVLGTMWMRRRTPKQIRRLVDRISPRWSELDKDSWAVAQHQFTRRSFPDLYQAFDRRRDWAGYLRRVTVPVLLVTAERGLTPPAEAGRILAALPHGEAVHVAGAGHNVRRDNYPDFMAAVRRFLAEG